MLKFREFDVFNFIHEARDHSIKVDKTLVDIDEEITQIKLGEETLKSKWIPEKLFEMKKIMTKEIVNSVNEINGGPVTEFKVFKMM